MVIPALPWFALTLRFSYACLSAAYSSQVMTAVWVGEANSIMAVASTQHSLMTPVMTMRPAPAASATPARRPLYRPCTRVCYTSRV